MGILALVRILILKRPSYLYNEISEAIYFGPKRWCQLSETQRDVFIRKRFWPRLCSAKDTRRASSFPYTASNWFNKLPVHIRNAVGTEKFTLAMHAFLNTHCFHKIKTGDVEQCKFCVRNTSINPNNEFVFRDAIFEARKIDWLDARHKLRLGMGHINTLVNIELELGRNEKYSELFGNLHCDWEDKIREKLDLYEHQTLYGAYDKHAKIGRNGFRLDLEELSEELLSEE